MKLSKKALGLTAGIFSGVGVFFVTNFFIIAGSGGVTLDTLHRLFFGYSFSFLGSIFGLIWGLVYGFIAGWLFAFLYNLFVKTS